MFNIKYKEFIKIVEKAGWQCVRQSGSHCIYKKGNETVIVPNHGSKEIPKGLQKALTKKIGL